MRIVVYACIAVGLFFSGWALSNLLAWWLIPSWHLNREPILAAFFLLIPAISCALLAPAVAFVNRRVWPRHLLIASASTFALSIGTIVVFWFTNRAPT